MYVNICVCIFHINIYIYTYVCFYVELQPIAPTLPHLLHGCAPAPGRVAAAASRAPAKRRAAPRPPLRDARDHTGTLPTPRRGLRAHGQLPAAPARSVRSQRGSQTIRVYKQEGLRPGEQTSWPCLQGATTGWPCLRGATTGFHGTLCLKISHWLSQ